MLLLCRGSRVEISAENYKLIDCGHQEMVAPRYRTKVLLMDPWVSRKVTFGYQVPLRQRPSQWYDPSTTSSPELVTTHASFAFIR
jgi:hypothetical protein